MRSETTAAAVDEFLSRAGGDGGFLLVEGEAGIGKTTLFSAVLEQARARGFRLLTARPNAAESVYSYASRVDLVRTIDSAVWAGLPGPQRRAVDRMQLRADVDDSDMATDEQAVAAGCLAAVEQLAAQAPLLVSIDDLHWLDPSSARVISYVVRRLTGPVGVLCTARDDPDSAEAISWFHRAHPGGVPRIQVQPLTLGRLHNVLSQRLGRSLSRPTMVQIYEVSGGNPFYALELGRALRDGAIGEVGLTATLTQLVDARIGNLVGDVQDVLLAAACAAAPTVELVAKVVDSDLERVTTLLQGAENEAVVELDGNRVRFAHPLLARGVYDRAAPALKRQMHRRLGGVVDNPESRARHLAMASVTASPEMLQSLDDAATLARMRGAPAAAAELLDIGIGLGGDTPERQIRSARHHFDAGDLPRARTLLDRALKRLPAGTVRAQAAVLLAAVRIYAEGYPGAVPLLEQARAEAGESPGLRVTRGQFSDDADRPN